MNPPGRRSAAPPHEPPRVAPSVESRLAYSYRPPALRRILLAVVLVVLLVAGGVATRAVLARSDAPVDTPAAVAAPSSAPSATPAAPDDPTVEAARAVLTRWSSPDLAYPRWWAGLRPLLTAGGQEAYAVTDPRRVPTLGALEEPRMRPGPSPDTATVWFGTEEGRYGVDLARVGRQEPWRGVRILFPGQSSGFR